MTSTQSDSPRSTELQSVFDFTLLFRAVPLAASPTRLAFALAGVVATVLLGWVLDAAWPASSSAVTVQTGGAWVTEAGLYARQSGAQNVHRAVEAAVELGATKQTQGVFDTLLFELRGVEDQLIAGVLGLRPAQALAALHRVLDTAAWLIAMHPLFAILFGLGAAAIWGFVGLAIARGVALEMATGEGSGPRESLDFARSRFLDGLSICVVPAVLLLVIAIGLWLLGLIGAIPFVGDIAVGIAFPLAVFAGAIMAAIIVLGLAALPMAPYVIAVGDADAVDALSDSASFVWRRPVRTAVYCVFALVVGVVAFALVKWFIALALWCGGSALGATMNIGAPSLADAAAGAAPGKLDAIWRAPTPSGATPFFGSFDDASLAGASWLARGLFRVWLMLLWALLASFAVCLFYNSAGIAFLLLRRHVDRTDITEIAVEAPESGHESADASP